MKILVVLFFIVSLSSCVQYYKPSGVTESSATLYVSMKSGPSFKPRNKFLPGYKETLRWLSEESPIDSSLYRGARKKAATSSGHYVLDDVCILDSGTKLASRLGKKVKLKEGDALQVLYKPARYSRGKGHYRLYEFTPQENGLYKLQFGHVIDVNTGRLPESFRLIDNDHCGNAQLAYNP